MLLSFSKNDSLGCLSSYQDYLYAKGELDSFILSLVKYQKNSLEKNSESSYVFQESFENRLSNTFFSNWDENEQEFIEDFALHFNIKKEQLIKNNTQKQKKDSNINIINNKKNMNLSSNSTVFIILRKCKNQKSKTQTFLKKKLLKIKNDFIKNNIPKKVYRKRKIIFYKSFLFSTYLLKHFYDIFKLIISKFLFFIKNLKIKIIFPNRRKSGEYISNIIKKTYRNNFINIIKGRKKTKKFLFNDFKDFIKVIILHFIFSNIIVNIIMIIIAIKEDILILLLNYYFFYNGFTRFPFK